MGPFAPDELPSLDSAHGRCSCKAPICIDDRARALLDRFRFVPDARLDDLMISYATDGGGGARTSIPTMCFFASKRQAALAHQRAERSDAAAGLAVESFTEL